METISNNGKTTPILLRLEQGINDLKAQTLNSSGTETPISKTLNYSISMVNQISRTMQEAINRFEERLNKAKEDISTQCPDLEQEQEYIKGGDDNTIFNDGYNNVNDKVIFGGNQFNDIIEDVTSDECIEDFFVGVKGKGITKTKFTGSGCNIM